MLQYETLSVGLGGIVLPRDHKVLLGDLLRLDLVKVRLPILMYVARIVKVKMQSKNYI